MSIIVLQVFVSLMLVAGSLVLFVWTVRGRTLEHAERLSLTPLDDDARPSVVAPAVPPRHPGAES